MSHSGYSLLSVPLTLAAVLLAVFTLGVILDGWCDLDWWAHQNLGAEVLPRCLK